MTHEELQAIKARAEAATPGPWRQAMQSRTCTKPEHRAMPHPGPPDCVYDSVSWIDSPGYVTAEDGAELCSPDDYGNSPREEDTAFIAHARTDVPALVAEVERLIYALASCEHARDLNQARARKAEALIAEVVPQLEWLASERDTYDLEENGIPALLGKLRTMT